MLLSHPRPLACYADADYHGLSRRSVSLFSEPALAAKRSRQKKSLYLVKRNGDEMAKQREMQEVTNDLPPVWGGENGPEPGSSIEGIYIGALQIKYRNKPFLTHQIQDEETGEILSFSGAIADRKMGRVKKGTYVVVTFVGYIKTANSDQTKDFRVMSDKSVALLDSHIV